MNTLLAAMMFLAAVNAGGSVIEGVQVAPAASCDVNERRGEGEASEECECYFFGVFCVGGDDGGPFYQPRDRPWNNPDDFLRDIMTRSDETAM